MKFQVSLKAQTFAPGTKDEQFVWVVSQGDTTVQSQSTDAPEATFDGLAPGSYVVTVSKLGVSAQASFDVVDNTPVTILVPDVVSVVS